ncbi:hypothetical protein D8674_036050 [Pyrus ussuriensis x Pyrus communis]|uniref:Phenolic glucoside malonyltransferase 1-like n=1 Tax=Pyrus ussuriensis x Pyrus communis TaxID=2448454 RepID=A0A5N5GSJ0_9ROSA|nr:hypothetical protein D8674_036050 [Pyrus ussuriensis x Pyrus communis]
MAKPGSVKVIEVCRVAPKPSSPLDSAHPDDVSLPLTFFDLRWLRFPPPQFLSFYNMPSFDPSHFFDSIFPKLKTSLSATLQHFVPLAGNLTWPPDSPIPLLSYVKGDAILLTIAESDADFHLSHDKAAVLALQITVFPNGGFSIGSAMHKAVFDGLSAFSFFKFWGHLCKHRGSEGGGPPPLPTYNRKVIKDPAGLQAIFSNEWAEEIKTEKVVFILHVDCRSRLDPPLPPTYFGNCIAGHSVVAKTKDLLGEDGLLVALNAISEVIKSLDKTLLEGAETWVSRILNTLLQPSTDRTITTAGSPQFEFYDAADFGWGRPTKHEIVSIDGTGAISYQKSKNGDGAVEVGLVLQKRYMEAFAYLFAEGLGEKLSRM